MRTGWRMGLIAAAWCLAAALPATLAAASPPQAASPVPATQPAPVAPPAAAAARPNIVFILTDDLAMNLLPYMPNVQLMQQQGTTFSAYFVTDSLCCPSRSTIMTGKYPHNTGVFTNTPPDGGYKTFEDKGNPAHTFAVALAAQGYRTAMLGKFLNGYEPLRNGPEPGWGEWDVAGNGYREFNYDLNRNGTVQHYGTEPAAYLTDVANGIADGFIRKSAAAGAPFFVEIATFAPHGPYTPAPRDADKFAGLTVPKTPAYGARPDANAPLWLKGIPALRPMEGRRIDADFRLRAQSVQAVDKMIGDLRATVAALGLAANTYFVFSSDNGYHMGDWSLRSGKQTPFDTDINVPLVVVGPGVAKGAVRNEIVANIDLAPTFAEIAGGTGPLQPDGVSLVPLLRGQSPAWRGAALIEHHHPGDSEGDDPDAPAQNSANPPSYAALRTATSLYVEYADGEVGFYDLRKDPYELRNIAPTTAKAELTRWKSALAANVACKGAAQCFAAASRVP